jgi:hypothetical protein
MAFYVRIGGLERDFGRASGMPIMQLHPIEFPDILWEVFVAGYLGYTGVRSWGKSKLGKN